MRLSEISSRSDLRTASARHATGERPREAMRRFVSASVKPASCRHLATPTVVTAAAAYRRCPAAIRSGRVSLTVASIDHPSAFGRPFDKILAVNNLAMWSQPALRLKEVAGLLRGGGLIAIVSQPRCPGATAGTTAAAASQIAWRA